MGTTPLVIGERLLIIEFFAAEEDVKDDKPYIIAVPAAALPAVRRKKSLLFKLM